MQHEITHTTLQIKSTSTNSYIVFSFFSFGKVLSNQDNSLREY